jgi:N-acetylglucosamine-6-sulfatase
MPQTRRLIGDRGVRFANAFSPHPICCPARASVLTGWYTHNHGVYTVNEPFAFPSLPDRSTIATWLQRSGYATVYLGKYLNRYGWLPEPGKTTGNSVRYVPPGWTAWRGSIDRGLPQSHWAAGGTYQYYVRHHVERERRSLRKLRGPVPIARLRRPFGRHHPIPREPSGSVLLLRFVHGAP